MHPRLHDGAVGWAIDQGRDKLNPTRAGVGKHTIADAHVIMPMLIERRTEALQEAHRTRACNGWRGATVMQAALDAVGEDPQHPGGQYRIGAQCGP